MRSAAALCRHLTTDRRTDGELLAAFLAGPAEDAFAELVRRYGPLVWAACRRLLPDPTDAEDAFQATFLILVRRAQGLTRAPALGPWLHQTAALTARSLRRKNARRLAHRTALTDQVQDPARPTDTDLKADLDAALLALPAHYRDPIILCHLQGFSRREAAERLGCPEGTLSAWLNRGLEKLRHRLRGLNPTQVLTVATTGVPVALTASTVQAAIAATVAVASVPPTVSLLVKGVIHMFWVQKATAAAFALTAVFALGVGVGLGTRTEYAGAGAEDKAFTVPKAKGESGDGSTKEIAALEAAIQKKAAFHDALDDEIRDVLKAADVLKEWLAAAQKAPAPVPGRDVKQAARDIVSALNKHNQLQELKNQAGTELQELKAKRDNLKGTIPVPPIVPPQDIDNDPEVVAQRKKMVHAQSEYEFRLNAADDKNSPGILRLKAAYEEQKKKYEELKKKTSDARLDALKDQITRLTIEREHLQKQANDAAADLAEVTAALAQRSREAGRLAARAETAEQLADLEAEVRKWEQKYQSARVGVDAAKQRFDLTKMAPGGNPKELLDDQLTLARFQHELETCTARLKEARDRLEKQKGTATPVGTGYLELTVGGKAGEYEFIVREMTVDSMGAPKRVAGPVTTRDPTALAKLLARTRNDSTGPQRAVVIAQPGASLSTGPAVALKACDAAGYKTVKFTGYVFGGGEAVPLFEDQTGNVPGYKRYDATEVKPADILKEIEDGLRRF